VVVGGWIAGGAVLGTAILVGYVAFTFELFCHGGVNDSYGAALALGLMLLLGLATRVIAGPRHRGAALAVYGAVYAVSLCGLGLAAPAMWGPETCSGFF
jgi:hypothetical protein